MVSLRFRRIKTTLKVEPTTQSRSPPLALSRLCALFLVIVRRSRDTHQVRSRRSASPISSCRFYTGETDFGALHFHDCILLPAFLLVPDPFVSYAVCCRRGDKWRVGNYRPISLFHCLRKGREKLCTRGNYVGNGSCITWKRRVTRGSYGT